MDNPVLKLSKGNLDSKCCYNYYYYNSFKNLETLSVKLSYKLTVQCTALEDY